MIYGFSKHCTYHEWNWFCKYKNKDGGNYYDANISYEGNNDDDDYQWL